MYKLLSIGFVALFFSIPSIAYEDMRDLPDIGIHLENLPPVEELVIPEAKHKKPTHHKKKHKNTKPKVIPVEASKSVVIEPIIQKQEVVEKPVVIEHHEAPVVVEKQALPEHKEAPVVVEKPASPEHHEAPLVVEKPAPIVSEPVIAQSAATPVATSSLASNQSIANSLIIVLNYAVSEVTLSPKNIEKLASLKSIIKNEKDKIINVVGYSSDNNTKDLNITGNLALQRVVEVRKYLISQNIDAAQISIHSASNKLPITIQDKVEITIIDSKRSKK